MIFEQRYEQCLKCGLSSMCKYKEDYYKNKGGNWRDEVVVYENNVGNCKYAPYKITSL